MLNSVPLQIAKGARAVTLRHPNAFDGSAWRKNIIRTAPKQLGGIPTLGGLGVLDSEDEPDYELDELGDCKILMVGQYQPSSLNDRETIVDMQYPQALTLIEPLAESGEDGYFMPDKHDVVFIHIIEGTAIGFEIIDIVGDVNISPYTRKYVLEKRDDLTYLDGFPK